MAQSYTHGSFRFCEIHLVKTEKHTLGIGSYRAVYRAKCDKLNKVLHPTLFQTRDPTAYCIVHNFEQKILFLSGLKHPYIIQYLDSR